jgi:hypothetical protein
MTTHSANCPASTTRTATRNTMDTKTTAHRFAVRNARSLDTDHADDLRASQLVNVAADEIAWFFTSYDNAPAACLARATIAGGLAQLAPAERRTLSLRFDVARWSEDLEEEGLISGFALAVHLVSTSTWKPKNSPRDRVHKRAGEHLEAAVREKGVGVLRDLGRRADWDFAAAVRAYAKARGRAPSVLPKEAA